MTPSGPTMGRPFTYSAGDLVRIHGEKHACKVVRINLDDTVDVVDARGLRTVLSLRVGPPRPGDVAPVTLSQAAPTRRRGAR